jgi:alkylated DNA nucleotide flippase Atl1
MSTDPSDYVEAVLALVERIPPGRVMSYGAIAEYPYEAFGRASPRRVRDDHGAYGGWCRGTGW